jgi:hypothetical protein
MGQQHKPKIKRTRRLRRVKRLKTRERLAKKATPKKA